MRQTLFIALLAIGLTGCSYKARNSEYRSQLRRATRDMLSVDFVDLIVEQEDENKEDYVVFSKEEAEFCNDLANPLPQKNKDSKHTYHVIKNDSGEWVYIKDR